MGEKQAWVNVPMTDEEVEQWLRIQDKGFARFAFRYGVVIVGALGGLLLMLHFAVNAIDGIPDNLHMLPFVLLLGLPVLGPFLACVACGMTWRLQAERYQNTIRQRGQDAKHDCR